MYRAAEGGRVDLFCKVNVNDKAEPVFTLNANHVGKCRKKKFFLIGSKLLEENTFYLLNLAIH